MSTWIKCSGRRQAPAKNSCTTKKLRSSNRYVESAKSARRSPILNTQAGCEPEDDDERVQCENLLAISAAMMEDIFCGELRSSLTTFQLKQGGCENRAMDFFLNVFAPAQKMLRITINASLYGADPLISAVFPLALHHEDLFHAVVAMSLCSMESQSFRESRGNVGDRASLMVFYHRGLCLSYLRNKLTPPCSAPDNAAMMTTTALLLLDGVLGDTESLRAHCLGLRQMIMSLGGINSPSVDKLLRDFVLQCDYCWSLEANLPVAFALPKFQVRNPFAAIPRAFQDLDLPDAVNDPLIDVIARMFSWTESVQRVWTSSASLEHQGLIFSYAPYHDAIEVLEILKEVQGSHHDSFTSALCLALVLISQNFYGKGKFYKWYQRVRLQLTELLLGTDLGDLDLPEQRCCVWIYLVAAESWRICGTLLPHGHELVRKLMDQFEPASDWDQLEVVLRSFLWNDSLGDMWKSCWEESVITHGMRELSDDSMTSVALPSNQWPPSTCPTAASLT